MSFPIRHQTHVLEQESETYLRQRLPQEYVIRRNGQDYGCDFQIEIAEEGQLRGLELLVQLKASNDAIDRATERIKINVSTYNYLRKKLQVVMFIKYVRQDTEAYWILLGEVPPPKKHDQKTLTFRIPKTNKISSIDWTNIADIIRRVNKIKLNANYK